MKPFPPAALPLFLSLAIPLWAAEAPSNLRAASPLVSGSSFELAWEDHADDEDGFEYQFSPDGLTDWVFIGTVKRNQSLVSNITGGALETTYYFRVRATSTASGDSDWSNVAFTSIGAAVPIWMGSRAFQGGTTGEQISTRPPETYGAPVTEFSATALPVGLSIDPSTGVISGIAPPPGIYRPLITATEGTEECDSFVTLRIKPASSGPIELSSVPDTILLAPPTDPLCLDLSTHLHDPDVPDAIRISTNLGDIDTILHSHACPASVENLLAYVDRGDYVDVMFHRSAVTATSGVEVIQAGNFKPDGAGDYTLIPTDPNVIDEPGLSNVAGSFAMAKTSSRHSGSNQWYFNTIDNLNLDGPQSNGGYTVFGRTAPASLPVIAEIQSRPRGNYSVTVDGLSQTLNDWPTTTVPGGASPTVEELIQIQSVTRLAPLTYTLNNNDNPALVSASLNGTELKLTPVAGAIGIAMITVDATDLDGSVLPVELSYCVLNLDLVPSLSPSGHLAATFTHEKLPASLSYELQSSSDGKSWTTFWTTSDGFAAPAVITNDDLGSQRRLTVENDSLNPPATTTALVRIVVTKS